ncbi:hypothetical protein AGMMS49546_36840 [Spirochaetia bacterium]|nr:hypothetical protein AGMMS49546_36840 [Spirochaetia bacterium]
MMSKKLLALALILAIVTGTVFAGGKSEQTAAGGGKQLIHVWTYNRHDLAFMEQKVANYNATNKDNIEVVLGSYSDNYSQTVNLAYQTGEAPDILAHDPNVFLLHVNQGRFADFTPLMDAKFKETFGSLIWDDVNRINEKVYFIPTMATTNRLFYNKGIFKRVGIEPPKTLEEMVTAAKKITDTLKGEGIYGFAQNMRSPQSGLSRSLAPMIDRQLGIHQGYDFAKGQYDFTGHGPVLAAWKELLSPAIAFPGCESLDIDPLRSQFAAGKIAMYFSYTHAEPGVYASQFPTKEEWGSVQIPVPGGNVKGAQNYQVTNGWMINQASKNIQTAWKVYVDLLANTDLLKEYYEQGLGITMVPEVIAKASPAPIFRDNPTMLITATDGLWPRTPHEANSAAVVVEGPNMWDTFASIIYANANPQQALADLTTRYNKALQAGIDQKLGTPIKASAGFNPMQPKL